MTMYGMLEVSHIFFANRRGFEPYIMLGLLIGLTLFHIVLVPITYFLKTRKWVFSMYLAGFQAHGTSNQSRKRNNKR